MTDTPEHRILFAVRLEGPLKNQPDGTNYTLKIEALAKNTDGSWTIRSEIRSVRIKLDGDPELQTVLTEHA
jgi:hypothetical protein